MPDRLTNLFHGALIMRTLSLYLSLIMALVFSINTYSADETEQPTPEQEQTMVTITTNHGEITLELDAANAPNTVDNFLSYVKSGHYNGTIFHRVIENFMIQGGGFEPGMEQKEVNAPIANEANNGLKNDEYTVAMARTGDPHSATAQFFINVKANEFLNFSSESTQGWGYAVFGKVTNGTDVVDKIKAVETGQNGHFSDVPVEDVIIESIRIADDA